MDNGAKPAANDSGGFLPFLDRRGAAWFLAAALTVLYFAFTSGRALWDPGEARYALIAREMIQSHDWLVPHMNGVLYFEKPPLGCWLNALAMLAFGYTEFAARFFSALSGLGMALFTGWFAARLFGRGAGVLSAAVLGTALGFFAWAQIPELDMLFTFLLCSGMGLIYLSFEHLCDTEALCAYGGYALLGLACLVKGPVAFALALLVIIPYLIIGGGWRRLKDLRAPGGIALAVAISAPWFVAISRREPDFFNFFFIHENFQRYSSTVHHRTGQAWYFIPVLAGALFPWTAALPAALADLREDIRLRGRERLNGLFLLCWAAMIFVFFSLSGSKRPPYILPAAVPLAIFAGRYFSRRWRDGKGFYGFAVPCLVLNLLVAAALAAAPKYAKLGADFYFNWQWPAALLAASGIAAVFFLKRGRMDFAWSAFLAGTVLFIASVTCQAGRLDFIFSRREISGVIMREFRPGDRLLAFDADYDRNFQSMGYYTGQRIAIVGDQGELEFGAGHEPRRGEYFPNVSQSAKLMQSGARYFMIVRKSTGDLSSVLGAKLYPGPQVAGRFAVFSNKPWNSTRAQ
jgi:4-amino-4-deoxy-L-arabinose transferase-like glycosyltransferase